MNILLVEDDNESVKACQEFAALDDRDINIVVANSLDEAKLCLNKDIDTAIIDVKLGTVSDAGNSVIDEINTLSLRIPTVIHTGTPANVTATALKVFTRGENTYEEIFDYLFGVYNTGITELLGRKGIFEKKLKIFYENCFLSDLDTWVQYGNSDSEATQKALFRYAVNNIFQLIDNDSDAYYPEEVYTYISDNKNISTGSLVKNQQNNFFIVLSPACDLALRQTGDFKTDSIHLVEVESIQKIEMEKFSAISSNCKNVGKNKNNLMKSIWTNTDTLYYHWLPKTNLFEGGVINFRKILTIRKDELTNYSILNIRVSPYFCRDIVSRFSSYYARQGQPEIIYEKYMYQENK